MLIGFSFFRVDEDLFKDDLTGVAAVFISRNGSDSLRDSANTVCLFDTTRASFCKKSDSANPLSGISHKLKQVLMQSHGYNFSLRGADVANSVLDCRVSLHKLIHENAHAVVFSRLGYSSSNSGKFAVHATPKHK